MQKSRHIPPAHIPDFEPVPRRYRHDGWTPERQRAFIDALADTGSVRQACARVGMASEGAYALRRVQGAEAFAPAWSAALDHGIRQLEDIALERAIHGVEVPVYSYGKLVGTRRIYNDRLLMFMLRNRAPHRFGHAGPRDSLLLDDPQEAEVSVEALDAELEAILERFLAGERAWSEGHDPSSSLLPDDRGEDGAAEPGDSTADDA